MNTEVQTQGQRHLAHNSPSSVGKEAAVQGQNNVADLCVGAIKGIFRAEVVDITCGSEGR